MTTKMHCDHCGRVRLPASTVQDGWRTITVEPTRSLSGFLDIPSSYDLCADCVSLILDPIRKETP